MNGNEKTKNKTTYNTEVFHPQMTSLREDQRSSWNRERSGFS